MKTTFLGIRAADRRAEQRIEELRYVADDSAVDISEEIQRLTKRSQTLTKDIYGKLTPWQVAQVARHAQRPYTLDYVQMLFTHFEELHGDRAFRRRRSIVGGWRASATRPCVVIRPTRKAAIPGEDPAQLRHAQARGLPQGAAPDEAGREILAAGVHLRRYARRLPGMTRGARQSEAIGAICFEMARLRTDHRQRDRPRAARAARSPSGGDVVLMLQYAIVFVISPEGCASILWRSAEQAPERPTCWESPPAG